MQRMTPAAAHFPGEGKFPSLDSATEWLSSPPLTAAGLRGQVVLVDIWTYTCINWLRTQPYVRAWAEKYQALGLVVLGVHDPEFMFEHDVDNVRRAVQDRGIRYPNEPAPCVGCTMTSSPSGRILSCSVL
jgi:thiol-disulfide isomerase/thioredoxin